MQIRTFIFCAATCLAAPPGDSTTLFEAIRNGNSAYIKAHSTKAELAVRDRRGATPLMHAAAFGNLETVKLLLDAGADVNAKNDFDATALLWAARDVQKARLLIEHGADVNAQSKQGRTPLMLASLRNGGADIVALMLAKGADVNRKDSRDSTALSLAASVGNVEAARMLIEKGALTEIPDRAGATALNHVALRKGTEATRLLIRDGANVNTFTTTTGPPGPNGPLNRTKVTPLHNAAGMGTPEMVQSLLGAGAKIESRDSRGLTPLHFALASDTPSLEIVRKLIQAGADVNARDTSGETPLDWAEKFGYPDVIAALKKAGARRNVMYEAPKPPQEERPKPAFAVARGIRLMEAASDQFFKKSGCVGCHHQSMTARAQAVARGVGAPVNEAAAKEQLSQLRGQWLPLQEEFLQTLNPGGGANRLTEMLLGLKASNYPADVITDSAIVDVAESQEPDGSWPGGESQNRPPLVQSEFGSTARAIRALTDYAIPARKQEFSERIARARAWLKKATPVTTEDVAMRLSGLTWSEASDREIRDAAKALLDLQRADGGWGGNPHLSSDAYATGVALVTLAESKTVKVTGRVYVRGMQYLLSTQFPDGSWHVRSRAIKFQPYFDSGFPFGHDQWISAAATSWAAQAIALGIAPTAKTSASR